MQLAGGDDPERAVLRGQRPEEAVLGPAGRRERARQPPSVADVVEGRNIGGRPQAALAIGDQPVEVAGVRQRHLAEHALRRVERRQAPSRADMQRATPFPVALHRPDHAAGQAVRIRPALPAAVAAPLQQPRAAQPEPEPAFAIAQQRVDATVAGQALPLAEGLPLLALPAQHAQLRRGQDAVRGILDQRIAMHRVAAVAGRGAVDEALGARGQLQRRLRGARPDAAVAGLEQRMPLLGRNAVARIPSLELAAMPAADGVAATRPQRAVARQHDAGQAAHLGMTRQLLGRHHRARGPAVGLPVDDHVLQPAHGDEPGLVAARGDRHRHVLGQLHRPGEHALQPAVVPPPGAGVGEDPKVPAAAGQRGHPPQLLRGDALDALPVVAIQAVLGAGPQETLRILLQRIERQVAQAVRLAELAQVHLLAEAGRRSEDRRQQPCAAHHRAAPCVPHVVSGCRLRWRAYRADVRAHAGDITEPRGRVKKCLEARSAHGSDARPALPAAPGGTPVTGQ